MRNYPLTHVVLLIDFDDRENRFDQVTDRIPVELRQRVFMIGARSEPEELKKAGLGTFEEIGFKLAEDCRSGSTSTWDHELLKHDRMLRVLKPILFDG
jgi:hypothetical protein